MKKLYEAPNGNLYCMARRPYTHNLTMGIPVEIARKELGCESDCETCKRSILIPVCESGERK